MNEENYQNLLRFSTDLEREWRSKHTSWYRTELALWKEELGGVPAEMRTRFLLVEIRRLSKLLMSMADDAVEAGRAGHNFLVEYIKEQATRFSRKRERYQRELKHLKSGTTDTITPDMIARAREYPLNRMINVNRNWRAQCPFHGGDGNNLSIKNNFAYCFSKGCKGDSIDVYRSLYSCSFSEAVLALQ